MWIANGEHSKRIDQRASEEFGIPAKVLMERAGLAVFDAVRELLPDSGRITVFCGKGNNGGDGFVVARLAKAADDSSVKAVVLLPDTATLDSRPPIRAKMGVLRVAARMIHSVPAGRIVRK